MLTKEELDVLSDIAEVARGILALAKGNDQSGLEMCNAIHILQTAVMANSAAREYPGKFRLLNGQFYEEEF